MNCNICSKPVDKHKNGLFCCPHCKHNDIYSNTIYDYRLPGVQRHFGNCKKCDAKGPVKSTEAEARTAWNTRCGLWVKADQPPDNLRNLPDENAWETKYYALDYEDTIPKIMTAAEIFLVEDSEVEWYSPIIGPGGE